MFETSTDRYLRQRVATRTIIACEKSAGCDASRIFWETLRPLNPSCKYNALEWKSYFSLRLVVLLKPSLPSSSRSGNIGGPTGSGVWQQLHPLPHSSCPLKLVRHASACLVPGLLPSCSSCGQAEWDGLVPGRIPAFRGWNRIRPRYLHQSLVFCSVAEKGRTFFSTGLINSLLKTLNVRSIRETVRARDK
jgi:hypothetical protein